MMSVMKSAGLVLPLLLALALPAVPVSAQLFPPREIWVQKGDPIPEVDDRVWPDLGHMAGDLVALAGTNVDITGFAVFLADRDGVIDLVGDRFWQGVHSMSFDGDWLAFDAIADFESDNGEPGGIHLYADGTLARILDWGSEIAGIPGSILSTIHAVSVEDRELVAAVSGYGAGNLGRYAILRYTPDGGFETLLIDGTPVPGAGATSFIAFTDAVLSDGVVYFRGVYPGGSEEVASTGIFALRDGAVERVAAQGDPLPGGLPGEVFDEFLQSSRLSACGGAVVFLADSDRGSEGLFWNVNGAVELAVGSQTAVPDGSGARFEQLGQAALSGDALVFEGDGVNVFDTGLDLYLLRDGELTRLIDAHCDEHLITPEAFRDGKVAFSRQSELPARLRVAYLETPPPQGETYTDPAFPGFRFTVRISAGGQTIATRDEPECQADALCIGGALEGRAEVTLRVLGPRDNGFYWPALARLTPSRVEVWIEQVSTGIVRYYLLEELPRDAAELPGLIDRRGFPVE
jgi:hypothetical protein